MSSPRPLSLAAVLGSIEGLPDLPHLAAWLGAQPLWQPFAPVPRGCSAAALVGTFLGILLCYGLFHPIATNAELQEVSNGKYLKCIKEGVVASLRGTAPVVAIEFARKAIFSDERPSADETDEACRQVKSGG